MNRGRPSLLFSDRLTRAARYWRYLLLLALVAQAMVPVQSHTRWQQHADGRWVELCTLQGTQLVRVDHDGDGQPSAEYDQAASPAMLFSGLLSHAMAATIPPACLQERRFLVPQAPCTIRPPRPPDLPDAPIRGPPALLT